MSVDGKLYFAYGSNINLDQMAYRCPNAEVVGPVVLENYTLLFRGNARGAGVATIVPRKRCKVPGLLWKITPTCEKSLDSYEGFPHLYDKEPVTVRDVQGRELTVMAYVMTDLCREPTLPSSYYYNGIMQGYRQNGLPVASLKRALDRTIREVQKAAERVLPKPPKGRNNHER